MKELRERSSFRRRYRRHEVPAEVFSFVEFLDAHSGLFESKAIAISDISSGGIGIVVKEMHCSFMDNEEIQIKIQIGQKTFLESARVVYSFNASGLDRHRHYGLEFKNINEDVDEIMHRFDS